MCTTDQNSGKQQLQRHCSVNAKKRQRDDEQSAVVKVAPRPGLQNERRSSLLLVVRPKSILLATSHPGASAKQRGSLPVVPAMLIRRQLTEGPQLRRVALPSQLPQSLRRSSAQATFPLISVMVRRGPVRARRRRPLRRVRAAAWLARAVTDGREDDRRGQRVSAPKVKPARRLLPPAEPTELLLPGAWASGREAVEVVLAQVVLTGLVPLTAERRSKKESMVGK